LWQLCAFDAIFDAFDATNCDNLLQTTAFDATNCDNLLQTTAFDATNCDNLLQTTAFDATNCGNFVPLMQRIAVTCCKLGHPLPFVGHLHALRWASFALLGTFFTSFGRT
jgi:hypothetical protein